MAGATGTFSNYQTLSLTPGDWLVYAGIELDGNGATATIASIIALSLFSGNTTADHVAGYNNTFMAQAITTQIYVLSVAAFHVLISATTTVYLKQRWNYSAGAPQADNGMIWAVRNR